MSDDYHDSLLFSAQSAECSAHDCYIKTCLVFTWIGPGDWLHWSADELTILGVKSAGDRFV